MAFTADFESYDFVWFVEVSVTKTLLIKLMEMDGKLPPVREMADKRH